LNHDLRIREEGSTIGEDLRALFDLERVWITRFHSRARFDDHLKSRLGKIRDYHGNERNPPFPRITLLGHANDHEVVTS
jgi:hypothetical protein